jgi:hypothetical protein
LSVIDLPEQRWESTAALSLTLAFAVAVALSPVDPPWRLLLAASTLLLGVLSYRRYRHRRPLAVETTSAGSLEFRLADSQRATVSAIRLGIVSPLLLTARCRFTDGTSGDLFVPAGILSRDEHWALRRAVVAFANTHTLRGR